MQENLITFETAKLAKEKGYKNHDCKKYDSDGLHAIYGFVSKGTAAPTQSLLQKWLREVHNTHLMVEPYYNGEKLLVYGFDLITERAEEETIIEKGFKTYEEALEIGLQEALKLIPNKK